MYRASVRFAAILVVTALVLAAIALSVPVRSAGAAKDQVVPDQYIVQLKPGANPNGKANAQAQEYGFTLRHIYKSTFNGYAATIPPGQLKKLQNDPDVLSITPDFHVTAYNDTRPTGIRRSQADRNSTSQIGSHTNPISVDVAVIDTGIDPNHPDLNVVGGINCVPGESGYADQNGHGTHVAGTIGALDNGSGVVGVAPGARLYSVRVLNAAGEGEFSDVMCGVDWVTANAGIIEVANMSLGGEAPVGDCDDGSLHEAICNSVAAGVTYVVAAGNSALDASGFVPAAYSEVITVSALADTDGLPGSRGNTSFFFGDDDEFANFSNFGAPVDIAAPGVNIYSTFPGGGFASLSGTSQASPHVAGAAAVYKFLHPSASPDDVRGGILSIAWAQNSADGFAGDPDGFHEPLLNVGAIGGDPLPPPQAGCTLTVGEGVVGSITKVSCVNFGASELVRVFWDSSSTNAKATFAATVDGSGSVNLTIPDSVGGQHQIIAQGASSGTLGSATFTVKPNVKVQTATVKVGGNLLVTLNGFAANTAVTLTWDSGTSAVGGATTSATGAATVFLTIPESAAGVHTIKATPAGAQAPVAESTVTVVPSLGLVLPSGKVGSNVTATLRGYKPGESIAVNWFTSATSSVKIADVVASSLGSATVNLVVPPAARGAHTVNGVGALGSSAAATYTVSTGLTLSPLSGPVGTNVTVSLTGYGANETVEVRWYDTATAYVSWSSVVTDANGSASVALPAREAANGAHKVEAVGPIGGTTFVNFTIAASIALSPAAGEIDDPVTVSLAGYRSGESITVKWYTTQFASTTVATVTASTTGSAIATFAVPAGATTGVHKILASGGVSFAQATTNFTVESDEPPPPTDPTCTLGATTGSPGVSLVVTCINFATSESIRVYWDDPASLQKASIWTGNTGGGSASFALPDALAGPHQVIAIGTPSGRRAEATFTIVPSLKLSVATGKVGTSVIATLKGSSASQIVPITWDGGATITSMTTSATGSASASFAVPESVGGAHSVAAGGTSAPFSIVGSISLSPTSGNVGSTVGVTLRGYTPSETVSIRWFDTGSASVEVVTATASALGSATASFTVPEGAKGAHRVDGVGSMGSTATATFTITPKMTVSPTTGSVGSNFELTLTGYGESEAITVQWFDTSTAASTIATLTTSGQGRAAATLPIPEATNGLHKLQANGAVSGATAFQFVTVKAALALSPALGPIGTTFTASATGYRANEMVNLAWFSTATASSVVATGQSNSFGRVDITIAVPTGATTGNHKVDATGQASFLKASGTFNVTAPAGGTSVGSESAEPAPPTLDVGFTDDFSTGTPGELLVGWSLASVSDPGISVKIKGNGNSRVSTSGDPVAGGSAWLIRDGAGFSKADVEVELRFTQEGSAAGVVLAWNGPNDYVAVIANAEHDRIDVVEVSGGVVRTRFVTADGDVRLDAGQEYRLRAESGADASGNRWVTVYWAAGDQSFEAIGSVDGLSNLGGGVGIYAGGPRPKVEFDDFSAKRGNSSSPIAIEKAPTAEPSETASPEPTATVEPTATPEPAPTDTPTPEPTPTQEPTATEEPIPTAEPTLAPPTETSTPLEEPVATEVPADAVNDETGVEG